ncbi:MAG: outer membrane lipoprotein carrier protein LolA [Sphingomonadaceae bacterium]
MRIFPILTALALIVTPAAAQPRQAVSLAEVQRAFAATSTMTADFTQTAGDGGVASGKMLLKRPGKVRFDYAGKTPYLVVADGRTLSFVDYQVSQVSQWPIRSTALGVLLDPHADLASVARVLPEDQSPVPGMVAVHAEDRAKPEAGSILFFLARDAAAPGGLRLSGWRVTDAQGNLTNVTLSNPRFNADIADSRFRFQDPRQRGRVPGRPG